MTTKNSKSTSRTKTGTLNKKAVAKAVKSVSTTRNKIKSTKHTTLICCDAQSGKFASISDSTFQKAKKSIASSKLRTKSGSLKKTIVKDAVASVSQSRSTQQKKE